MKNILLFALPFLGENIYYISSVRKFYRQKLICKMLPAVFVNFIKIIFSSFLAKKKNKDMSYHIIVLTLFFETFAILNAVYSTRLTGIHNAIALNSKFIFIALLSFVMLKKKFTIMQMIGQSIILGGILYSGYSSKSDNDIKSTYTHFTFLAIIFSGFMSSLGNVYFEKYIRHRIIDFHTYNMEYASTHLFVSLFTETVELLLGGISRIGNTVSNYKFYNFIFVSCFHTSLLTWISTKIEPVIRSFLFLIVTTTTSIVIDYMESGSVKTSNIITLLAVNVGILCYETENVKKIIKKLISKKEK